ncbi:hypothetical protein LY78DRAFT_92857 [Colletotrichum sublineola]|nr:hypothetical protein LY78DRAFT_92857 [Colletotrichum sublineola]
MTLFYPSSRHLGTLAAITTPSPGIPAYIKTWPGRARNINMRMDDNRVAICVSFSRFSTLCDPSFHFFWPVQETGQGVKLSSLPYQGAMAVSSAHTSPGGIIAATRRTGVSRFAPLNRCRRLDSAQRTVLFRHPNAEHCSVRADMSSRREWHVIRR